MYTGDFMASKAANKKNSSTQEQRANKKELGTVAIETVKRIVDILKPYELSPTNRLRTFQSMMMDDSVFNCFDSASVLVEKAFRNYKIEFDNNSPESVKAKEFLEWNLKHLADQQSLGSIARSGMEFLRDGLAPFEKVYERSYGDYEKAPNGSSAWKLARLNYIHPLTLNLSEPFTIADGGRSITHMRQDSSAFKNSPRIKQEQKNKGYVEIPMNKVVLMTRAATHAQPFGKSVFESVYTAWREKLLFQDLTAVGVSKDLAGTPILEIPSNILNTAANDPQSPEGMMVSQLKEQMANLHAGDQTHMILPSDVQGETGTGSSKEFSIKFLGVDGKNKNFDMEALIEQRRKFIYSVFGASHLIAADSSGGYNQLEGQVAIHKHYVDRDIAVIEEALNSNVIPQLFRLNEWKLSHKELPKVKAGNITPNTIEEFSKGIQRVGAVGMLPRTPEVVNEILAGLGIDYRVDSSISQEELDKLLTDASTKSGEGMKQGMPNGTGDSNKNNSDTNSDNKA